MLNSYPDRSHNKLNAVGINQTDDVLGENKRHLPSIIEFYTKQTQNTVHFLIDEVDGQMFTKEYSKSVKGTCQNPKMIKLKIIFAM